MLWGIVNLVPEDTTQGSLRQLGPLSPTLTSLVVAWSLSEIIRYGFFAAKVPGCHPANGFVFPARAVVPCV